MVWRYQAAKRKRTEASLKLDFEKIMNLWYEILLPLTALATGIAQPSRRKHGNRKAVIWKVQRRNFLQLPAQPRRTYNIIELAKLRLLHQFLPVVTPSCIQKIRQFLNCHFARKMRRKMRGKSKSVSLTGESQFMGISAGTEQTRVKTRLSTADWKETIKIWLLVFEI